MNDKSNDLTLILGQIEAGDESAKQQLFAAAYDELHQLAERLMRDERASHTLQPTALVNEAGMRFLNEVQLNNAQSRALFFWTMSRAMRQVLVDHARRRGAQRRGGDQQRVGIEFAEQVGTDDEELDVLALDEALEELQTMSERQAKVVELRFFGGFEMKEIAEQLDVSLSTIEKDWRIARAWLQRKLG